jgi:hypothetical protein
MRAKKYEFTGDLPTPRSSARVVAYDQSKPMTGPIGAARSATIEFRSTP